MIKYSKGNMTSLLVAGAMLLVSGCFSDIKDYCEESNKCENGNENDEKACVEELKGTRKWFKQYGCKKEFDEYYECYVEEMDCVNDSLTDENECASKNTKRWECVAKNSNLYGDDANVDTDPYGYYDDLYDDLYDDYYDSY